MAEKGRQQQPDKYIQCSTCQCKHINDNDHIKKGLGYNRLEERYKTCIKCRERRKVYDELHHESIYRKRQTYNMNNRDKINEFNYEKIECESCGDKVCRNAMRRHEREKCCNRSSGSASSD